MNVQNFEIQLSQGFSQIKSSLVYTYVINVLNHLTELDVLVRDVLRVLVFPSTRLMTHVGFWGVFYELWHIFTLTCKHNFFSILRY